MAELKTLTIDGISNSIDAGKYIQYDADGIALPVKTLGATSVPNNANLPNNSMTELPGFTITKKGLYVFFWHLEFSANATGVRYMSIRRVRGSSNEAIGGAMRTPAAPTGQTILSCVPIRESLEVGDQIILRCYQSSGATLQVVGSYYGFYIEEETE